ncbi:MAG TPA: CoA pyrophosphatase, partial [Candidatus Thermoplasmatota archaeon]
MFRPTRDPSEVPPGASSVLMPIVLTRSGLSILFTRRTKNMSAFAGHLSFPGGRIDPTDETPLAAALRETEEEIGLTSKEVVVLGHFTELHTHFGTLVICFAGALHQHHVPTRASSPREVEEILQVPIESFLRPGQVQPTGDARHYVASSYESRRIGVPHAPSRTLHY